MRVRLDVVPLPSPGDFEATTIVGRSCNPAAGLRGSVLRAWPSRARMIHFSNAWRRSMSRIVASVLLVMVCLVPAVTSAHSFTSLVVIGDSLSDSGRAFALSEGFFPPSPPYAQRLSNGPV